MNRERLLVVVCLLVFVSHTHVDTTKTASTRGSYQVTNEGSKTFFHDNDTSRHTSPVSFKPKTCTMDSDCYKNQICKLRRNARSRFGICMCRKKYQFAEDGNCVRVEETTLYTNSDLTSNVTESPQTVATATNASTKSVTPAVSDVSMNSSGGDGQITNGSVLVTSTTEATKIEDAKLNKTVETTETTTQTTPTSTKVPPIRKLIVSVGGSNKVLQLPENKISVSAFAVPDPPDGEKYKYEWSLINHPPGDNTGREEDRHTKTLQLFDLKQGLYTFKVEVTGKGAYGEKSVNVTVKPPKRKNKPPVAIILPKNTTINLPNTDAVLDGSQSTDDEKIVKYQWEEVVSPIEYETKLTQTATLQLKDLIAGFYQFKLTVTDSDDVTNSTVANVTVLKEVDYPPVANAGEDVVIFLPDNNYILNGNLSSDDKGIKEWEWSKSPDTKLPVDVQGTQSPFLHLTNLQKGMYKFVLKVTDEVGQYTTADVHILVKEKQISDPPKVNAGKDIEIDLTEKFVQLDGSGSEVGEKSVWKWSQISGPSQAVLEDEDKKIAKASKLTVGKYEFMLEVTDKKNQKGTDNIVVTVKQAKNQPPKANGGGDKTVVLPVRVVALNGSLSSDDRGITSYKWTRDPSSVAAGEIIEDSDSKPILKIINIIPGRYIFTLKVTDEQGDTSSDAVSLIVKRPVDFMDEVQLTLNVDLKSYTEANKETTRNKLALLLNEGSPVNVVIKRIFSDIQTGRVIIIFSVHTKITESDTIVKGPDVVMRLKDKLDTDNLLDFDIVSLETVVCQNNCSSHGTCEPYTKRCVCDAFWMENFIRIHLGDAESNCEWSILYVIIVIFVSILSCIGFMWFLICFCRRKKKKLKPKKRHRYTLLDTTDDGDEIDVLSKGQIQKSSLMVSESDTDSDCLYERNLVAVSNSNGYSKMNGLNRHSRRIKA